MSTLNIKRTAKLERPYTHWFFYGPTGSGKTTVASTFPDPLFLVPCNEGSELTLRDHKDDYEYIQLGRDEKGNVTPVRAHMLSILSALEHRQKKSRGFQAKAAKASAAGDNDAAEDLLDQAYDAFPWQTIVHESMTHYCDLVIDDISRGGQERMDQQKWGHLAEHMRTVHSRLRNLDAHVVYTALDKLSQDDGAKVTSGGPAISGSMASKLPSACDVIGYCEEIAPKTSKKGEADHAATYRVHFRRYKWFKARSRFKQIPRHVDGFNFNEVRKSLGV